MKKGFTLIELLAVIVILSIILLIAVGLIGNVIDNVKQSAFESSSKGMLNAVKTRIIENKMNNIDSAETIVYENGIVTSGTDLSYSGNKPESGKIIIKSNGNVLMVLYDGTYCSMKNENTDKITVTKIPAEDCTMEAMLVEPIATIALTQTGDILTTTPVDFNTSSYQTFNGTTVINEEWQNRSALYSAGTHIVRYRVQDSNEVWSQWSEITFDVHNETDIKQVAGGWHYSLMITYGGHVKVAGGNGAGQLGTGNASNSSTFIQTSPTNVINVDAQYHESFGLKNNGTVYVWGYNEKGQLGTGSTTTLSTPIVNASLSNVKQIASGGYHSAALLNDGTVKIWGTNSAGELGLGLGINATVYSPAVLTGISDVKKIGLGTQHTILLMNDGTVKAFGQNCYGQLGRGNTSSSSVPITVPGLTDVVDIFIGGNQNFALLSDGTVKAWGYNAAGQLGIGNSVNQLSPVTVAGLTDVKQIASSEDDGFFTLALLNDGTVKAFGQNTYGQLGMGNTTSLNVPTLIPGLTDVTYIGVGSSHSMAILKNNVIKTWGRNDYGQLGAGNLVQRNTPTVITVN